MSDSRHQSYYEIALTNRQVVGVFVVLLVCVLGAFVGGVWVGRGDGPAVATVEPAAISSGVAEGEKPLEELDFFSHTESVLEQESAPETVAAETDAPAEPSVPVIIENLEEQGGEASANAPVEAPTPPPVARQEELPGEAVIEELPAEATGEFVVQVFSSSDEVQARRVLERIREGDYPASLSPVDVDGKPMYRVRVGPYMEREKAQEVADLIRRAYRLDTWITR